MITPAELADELRISGTPFAVQALHNALVADSPGAPAQAVDVQLSGGLVVALYPAGALAAGPRSVDLTGYLLLPAAAEPHAHLDKAMSGRGFLPAYGDLMHAIDQWHTISATLDTADFYVRARATALNLLSLGITAIRTHCDLLPGADPLRGLLALLAVREDLAPVMDIEVCLLPSWETPAAVIADAMAAGADLMGGCPHISPDPRHQVRALVALARQYETGLDIHADEQLDPQMQTLLWLAREVRDHPLPGTVTAGHCVSLGSVAEPERSAIISEVAAAGVAVVALPITNLYLQGWADPVRTPRGLTAAQALLDGGVTLAAGGDNIRDPFNPVGRGDPLETASLLVTAGHLRIEQAYAAVSSGARRAMGLQPAGVVVGARADLLACVGDGLTDVIASAPADRVVIHHGAVVAATVSSRGRAVREPAVREPAVREPAVREPAVREPAVREPAVREPAVGSPAIRSPQPSQIAATNGVSRS